MMFNVCPCQCSPLPLPLVNTQKKKTAAPKGSPLPKAPARGRNFCWHVDMAGSLPRSKAWQWQRDFILGWFGVSFVFGGLVLDFV